MLCFNRLIIFIFNLKRERHKCCHQIEYSIIFLERAGMGLFFKEKEGEYSLHGTGHWETKDEDESKSWISGCFSQRTAHGRIVSIEFNCNDESIYFLENGHKKSLDLCLTVMEERFSFLNHERVYEIKLKRKNLITLIFTTNQETFTVFYTHLAKYCVLRNFQQHFRLTTPLGSGSFSKVYNGQNIFSKEQVALKVFDKQEIKKISDGETIIMNEISNLQKLRKFKLSPLIETYETHDCIVIVMQKAQAGNMFDFLKEHQNNYNEELIKKMTFRVLENLDELHSAGFIHRDIKPENILFKNHSTKSSLFFGDFGLTVEKNQCKWTKIGRMCSGTMGFIAPQVLHDNTYDEKCDIFSLGCLFYFLHKGQSIFKDKNQDQIREMTVDNRIIERKINALNNLTAQSKDLMTKLLKTDPKQRLSAKEAMQHQYFARMEHHKPMTGEEDHTLREYLSRRIDHFFK